MRGRCLRRRPPARRGERGIALLVVMIVVLLSSLLALWSFRSSLVNEAIVGNDADYQRAFEAAQAMVQDAELDIRGARPDGTVCVAQADERICRRGSTTMFIEEIGELALLVGSLQAQSPETGCRHGICAKRLGAQDFWNDPQTWGDMIAQGVGARFGEYTGALPESTSGAVANPLLVERTEGRGAWYWVEVLQYGKSESSLITNATPMLELNLSPHVVYRITAVAQGLKPRTRVVLQSTFARQKLRD